MDLPHGGAVQLALFWNIDSDAHFSNRVENHVDRSAYSTKNAITVIAVATVQLNVDQYVAMLLTLVSYCS